MIKTAPDFKKFPSAQLYSSPFNNKNGGIPWGKELASAGHNTDMTPTAQANMAPT